MTGGVRGPTRVVNALLFRYWHSRGSMADASHSLTEEEEKGGDVNCSTDHCAPLSVAGQQYKNTTLLTELTSVFH